MDDQNGPGDEGNLNQRPFRKAARKFTGSLEQLHDPKPPDPQARVLWEVGSWSCIHALPNEELLQFVVKSDAYQWLLLRIKQYGHLTSGLATSMVKIGAQLHSWLRMQELFHALSRQRSRPPITVRFKLDLNPAQSLLMSGMDPAVPRVLDTVLCLTGTVREGQATTVFEYMSQTWPATWKPIAGLLSQLLARPEGEMQTCKLNSAPAQKPVSLTSGPMRDAADDPDFGKHSLPAYLRNISLEGHTDGPDRCVVIATGGLNYISDVAQQLGWLVATLKRYSAKSGLTIHSPYIQGFESRAGEDGASPSVLGGVCSISCESVPHASQPTLVDGQCWLPLFSNPVLVHGYPILQRLKKRHRPRDVVATHGILDQDPARGPMGQEDHDERIQLISCRNSRNGWRGYLASPEKRQRRRPHFIHRLAD